MRSSLHRQHAAGFLLLTASRLAAGEHAEGQLQGHHRVFQLLLPRRGDPARNPRLFGQHGQVSLAGGAHAQSEVLKRQPQLRADGAERNRGHFGRAEQPLRRPVRLLLHL